MLLIVALRYCGNRCASRCVLFFISIASVNFKIIAFVPLFLDDIWLSTNQTECETNKQNKSPRHNISSSVLLAFYYILILFILLTTTFVIWKPCVCFSCLETERQLLGIVIYRKYSNFGFYRWVKSELLLWSP